MRNSSSVRRSRWLVAVERQCLQGGLSNCCEALFIVVCLSIRQGGQRLLGLPLGPIDSASPGDPNLAAIIGLHGQHVVGKEGSKWAAHRAVLNSTCFCCSIKCFAVPVMGFFHRNIKGVDAMTPCPPRETNNGQIVKW